MLVGWLAERRRWGVALSAGVGGGYNRGRGALGMF